MPFLAASDEVYIKPWLVKTLEPICDADPAVLSDYVLALLKHNEPEAQLRTGIEKQLSEFLEAEASPFVEKLFRAIRSKSYLPYEDVQPSSSDGIRIPVDAALGPRGTKRGADDDSGFARQPPKGPRLSSDGPGRRPQADRGGPRNSDGRGGRGGGVGRGAGRGGAANGGGQGRNGRSPEPCRDYHNMGYCPRGETCPYTHGDEAIVPPMGTMGFMGPNGMSINSMPGMNPAQMMAMMQGGFPWMMDPSMMGGNGYNPNEPQMDMSMPGPPNRRGDRSGRSPNGVTLTLSDSQQSGPSTSSANGSLPPQNDAVFDDVSLPNGNGYNGGPQRGGPRGRGAGRGGRGQPMGQMRSQPGTFPSSEEQPSFDAPDEPSSSSSSRPGAPPGKRPNDTKTIVVEKIPPESLSLPAISSWFSKFGSVTNVAIDARTSKALVSFSSPSEAHAAWASKDAIFGDRFVRVFWHRPMAGKGELGAQKLAASAPLVQGTTPTTSTNGNSSTTSTQPPSNPTTAPTMTPAESIAARKAMLEKQIAEQKALFARLDAASTPQEKKEIMAELRKLGEEMKSTKATPSSSSASSAAASRRPSGPAVASDAAKEKLMREKLDRELDTTPPTSTADPSTSPEEGERKSALLAELEELRKQAAEAGVPSNVISGAPAAASSYRGRGGAFARGRGRGARGGYVARGAAPGGAVRSMKLDNRPKTLVVKGVNVDDSEGLASMEEFYKNLGPVESFEPSGTDEVHVRFQTRAVAELAISKGTPAGSSSVSWLAPGKTGPLPSVPLAATSSTSISSSAENGTNDAMDDGGTPVLIVSTLDDDNDMAPGGEETASGAGATETGDHVDTNDGDASGTSRAQGGEDDGGWGAGGGFDD
ncbi:hypothetical protein DL93DRAFT_2160767 [Clavulina sp. PMI_390]|nr:hypothetical protein DL93DRAFT_2160767 [Clavulina sp. PMI_390]